MSLIPFRDSVLFPGAEQAIYVGRETTINAIKYAKDTNNGEIAVFTQIAAENPTPMEMGDIYHVGTRCRISAVVELKDQSMKVMLEGLHRIRMLSLTVGEEFSMVTVESFPESTDTEEAFSQLDRQELLHLLKSWNPAFDPESELIAMMDFRESKGLFSAVRALRALTTTPRIAGPNGEEKWWDLGKSPALYVQFLNSAVNRRQLVLEENDFLQQLILLRRLMTFDIACRAKHLA
jgi:ATP-dependent Lon protease